MFVLLECRLEAWPKCSLSKQEAFEVEVRTFHNPAAGELDVITPKH